MNLLAVLMFTSLVILILSSIDPNSSSTRQIKSVVTRISIGSFLGFLLILLYGLGIPGLKYVFMLIGFGGFAHLFLMNKQSVRTPKTTISLSS